MSHYRSSYSLLLKNQQQPLADVLQNSVPNNFVIFKRKNMCWSLFNKVTGLPLYCE